MGSTSSSQGNKGGLDAEFGDGSSKSSVCNPTAPLGAGFWGCCSPLCPSSQTQNFMVKKYLSRCWGSGSSGTQIHHQLSNNSSSDVPPGSHRASSQHPPRMGLPPNLGFASNGRWKWGTGRIPPQFLSLLDSRSSFPSTSWHQAKVRSFCLHARVLHGCALAP